MQRCAGSTSTTWTTFRTGGTRRCWQSSLSTRWNIPRPTPTCCNGFASIWATPHWVHSPGYCCMTHRRCVGGRALQVLDAIQQTRFTDLGFVRDPRTRAVLMQLLAEHKLQDTPGCHCFLST